MLNSFRSYFTTSNSSQRLSQPQHLSRPLQCAAVKLGNSQPCTNEALSENDFCAIHLNWHNRPGHHAICRELRYVPSADSPCFQQENHAVQTQIQTAGTNWQEELVKTGDPPATHPGQQVFADALGSFGAGSDINMTWETLEAKFPESAKVLKNFDLQVPPSTEKARDIAKALVGCILQTQVNASTESAFLGRTSADENTKFLVIALLPKFKKLPFGCCLQRTGAAAETGEYHRRRTMGDKNNPR